MKSISCLCFVLVVNVSLSALAQVTAPERWSPEKANQWYLQTAWPVGANFVPSTAINQLEMWQSETWDAETINRELGWAAAIGMNTMRVFLHDIPWSQDSEAFLKRIDEYLVIADKHGIRTTFVFFDSVWHPNPKPGKQPAPTPGIHNSGWVQSPGIKILNDSKLQDQLKPYVQGVLQRFKDDQRVLMWDLFNEPENTNGGSYGPKSDNPDLDAETKSKLAIELIEKAFQWAREINPSQPLTVGVWTGAGWAEKPTGVSRVALDNSDVISFHLYSHPEETKAVVTKLSKHGRPLACTEYMARSAGSTFEGQLPVFKEHRVAAYNWGLVAGKSNTIYPWRSWKDPFDAEPQTWFHDVFRNDGTPYRQTEVDLIKRTVARVRNAQAARQQVRVACVGDSITFGTGINNREKNNYPAQLSYILGDEFQVRNFGVNGATLLKKGDIPWLDQAAFKAAQAFRPDVVIINLGANDTKPQNIGKYPDEFTPDYLALIESFRGLENKPVVYLCDPVPVFNTTGGITRDVMDSEIRPRIREIAKQAGCNIINLNTPLIDRKDWVPDGVHPNDFGAEVVAHTVADHLRIQLDPTFDIESNLKSANVEYKEADFHGHAEFRFSVNGTACRIVKPHVAAKDKPWVWRARFYGHQPQFDIAMLQRGWHVCYCEVGGLYGAPDAIGRWDAFYAQAKKLGLGPKPFLEGMSRGGLIIHNWAKANPKQVLAIYGDNPVCDGRSWPGGKSGKYSEGDWQGLLQAYGITEEASRDFKGFPIDGLEPVAKAGVPILHINGTQDTVVPPAENSEVLIKRFQSFGGHAEVIWQIGNGHHPHSLKNPSPIVAFAQRASGSFVNPAALATPSSEYRGGPAGWGGGDWWRQEAYIKKVAAENPGCELVFFGDSITQNWTGHRDRAAKKDGKRAIDRHFAKYNAIGMGISGDRTEHLNFRVENGAFDAIDPKVIVVMIGVNNLNARLHTGAQVADGMRSLVKRLREKEPQAKIILMGCFPTHADANSDRRKQSSIVHDQIKSLGDETHVFYRDLRSLFVNDDGTLNHTYMGDDNIHIKGPAYEKWAEFVAPTIRKIIGN